MSASVHYPDGLSFPNFKGKNQFWNRSMGICGDSVRVTLKFLQILAQIAQRHLTDELIENRNPCTAVEKRVVFHQIDLLSSCVSSLVISLIFSFKFSCNFSDVQRAMHQGILLSSSSLLVFSSICASRLHSS